MNIRKPLRPGEKRKHKDNNAMIKLFLLTVALITLLIIYDELSAGGYGGDVTNITNNYPATITDGISKKELAQGMAMSMAHGGHQFDYSYNGLQGSVAWVSQINEDEQNAYSGALGYNFIDKLDIKALGTLTFTPEQDEKLGDFLMLQSTFRF